MLKKFAVTNYRGFSDRIEFDLSKSGVYQFNQFALKDKIIKNGIIYGRNGSGKSSFGLAIFDIANHLSHKWKKPDFYINYASTKNHLSPVDFEYSFSFDGDVLEYHYSKIAKELKGILLQEKLVLNGKELFYKDSKDLRVSKEFNLSKATINSLLESENHLSIFNFLVGTVPLKKDSALLKMQEFIENMLFFRSLDYREFIGFKSGGSNIEEYIINHHLTEDFSKFLKDTSGQEYTFVKQEGEKILYCEMDNVKIPFSLVASTGTLNLELQYFWLNEMKGASFVFVDEFDAFYHYELSYQICKKLFEGSQQVFVTTHDTFLLTNDLLRPDCFFVLKDNHIDAICDLTDKELRLGHNLEKLYRGGTFGV